MTTLASSVIPTTGGIWSRFLRFPLTRIVLSVLMVGGLVVAVQQLARAVLGVARHAPMPLGVMPLIVVTAIAAYVAYVRPVERRAVTELAVTGAAAELARGVLLGCALFSLTIGLLWLLGYYQVTGTNSVMILGPVFALSIVSAVFEEILMRAILFRIVEEALGTWIALALSALLFGLIHLGNPNATLWGGMAIALEAGVLLAALYLYTGRLWGVIGLHFAWNFTQGGIFGVAISGNASKGLLQASLNGPVLMTGGAFGAEASVVAVLLCLATGAWLISSARKQGRFVRPFWKR